MPIELDYELLKELLGDHGPQCGCSAHEALEQERQRQEQAKAKQGQERQQAQNKEPGLTKPSNDPSAEPDQDQPDNNQGESEDKDGQQDQESGQQDQESQDQDSPHSQSPESGEDQDSKDGEQDKPDKSGETSSGKEGEKNKPEKPGEKEGGDKTPSDNSKHGGSPGRPGQPRPDDNSKHGKGGQKKQPALNKRLLNSLIEPPSEKRMKQYSGTRQDPEHFFNTKNNQVGALDLNQYAHQTAQLNMMQVYDRFNPHAQGSVGWGSWGGNDLSDRDVAELYNSPDVEQLSYWILKLVEHTVGSGIYQSPRIDYKKLIHQIYSKNINLERCGREEMEKKRLLIICDISGSTSALCNAMAAAAYRVFDKDDRCTIMMVSNETIYRIVGGGVTNDVLNIAEETNTRMANMYSGTFGGNTSNDRAPEFAAIWRELLTYLSTRFVVSFHDTDGEQVMRGICGAGIPLIWMLNACATSSEMSGLKNYRDYMRYAEEQRQLNRLDKAAEYEKNANNCRSYAPSQKILNWERPPIAVIPGADKPVNAIEAIKKYISHNEGRIIL